MSGGVQYKRSRPDGTISNMTAVMDSDPTYYTTTIVSNLANDTGVHGAPAIFSESRIVPLVPDTYNYSVSLESLRVDTKSVPSFIADRDQKSTDPSVLKQEVGLDMVWTGSMFPSYEGTETDPTIMHVGTSPLPYAYNSTGSVVSDSSVNSKIIGNQAGVQGIETFFRINDPDGVEWQGAPISTCTVDLAQKQMQQSLARAFGTFVTAPCMPQNDSPRWLVTFTGNNYDYMILGYGDPSIIPVNGSTTYGPDLSNGAQIYLDSFIYDDDVTTPSIGEFPNPPFPVAMAGFYIIQETSTSGGFYQNVAVKTSIPQQKALRAYVNSGGHLPNKCTASFEDYQLTKFSVGLQATKQNPANPAQINLSPPVQQSFSDVLYNLTISRALSFPSDGSSATGGTIIISNGYVYHTFTTSGTFTPLVPVIDARVLVVGGGGGGGSSYYGGGGGAGAVVQNNLSITGPVTVTIGAGGAGTGANGSTSSCGSLTAIGGGGGGNNGGSAQVGASGGGASGSNTPLSGGAGGGAGIGYAGGNNVPYGTNGYYVGGGGGGFTSVGGTGVPTRAGAGGTGIIVDLFGRSYSVAGGGGGGCPSDWTGGSGSGSFGGGNGGSTGTGATGPTAALPNTGSGGGGGGGDPSGPGGAGGSGLVVVAYPLSALTIHSSMNIDFTNTFSAGNTMTKGVYFTSGTSPYSVTYIDATTLFFAILGTQCLANVKSYPRTDQLLTARTLGFSPNAVFQFGSQDTSRIQATPAVLPRTVNRAFVTSLAMTASTRLRWITQDSYSATRNPAPYSPYYYGYSIQSFLDDVVNPSFERVLKDDPIDKYFVTPTVQGAQPYQCFKALTQDHPEIKTITDLSLSSQLYCRTYFNSSHAQFAEMALIAVYDKLTQYIAGFPVLSPNYETKEMMLFISNGPSNEPQPPTTPIATEGWLYCGVFLYSSVVFDQVYFAGQAVTYNGRVYTCVTAGNVHNEDDLTAHFTTGYMIVSPVYTKNRIQNTYQTPPELATSAPSISTNTLQGGDFGSTFSFNLDSYSSGSPWCESRDPLLAYYRNSWGAVNGQSTIPVLATNVNQFDLFSGSYGRKYDEFIQIHANTQFVNLFNGFNVYCSEYINPSNGVRTAYWYYNFKITPQMLLSQGANVMGNEAGTTGITAVPQYIPYTRTNNARPFTWTIVSSETSRYSHWNPATSVVLEAQVLSMEPQPNSEPVVLRDNDSTSDNTSGRTNKILAEVFLERHPSEGSVIYYPQAGTRKVSLTSGPVVKSFSYSVLWRNRFTGETVPLLLSNGGSVVAIFKFHAK